MGLFDIFRSSRRETVAPVATAQDRKVQGPAKVVADKRAQGYDRLDAIQALIALRSTEAAVALLKRFAFSADPSISDQEEKELAFQGILDTVNLGSPEEVELRRQQVIEAIRSFSLKAEQLAWPLKLLKALLPDERYGEELTHLLGSFDTEYSRNVEPKVQLIAALEGLRSESIRTAVLRFLEDANETVRFHAVQTTFAQGSEEAVPALVGLLRSEESVRIKNRVGEGFCAHGWQLPEELRVDAKTGLRDTGRYGVDEQGRVQRY